MVCDSGPDKYKLIGRLRGAFAEYEIQGAHVRHVVALESEKLIRQNDEHARLVRPGLICRPGQGVGVPGAIGFKGPPAGLLQPIARKLRQMPIPRSHGGDWQACQKHVRSRPRQPELSQRRRDISEKVTTLPPWLPGVPRAPPFGRSAESMLWT